MGQRRPRRHDGAAGSDELRHQRGLGGGASEQVREPLRLADLPLVHQGVLPGVEHELGHGRAESRRVSRRQTRTRTSDQLLVLFRAATRGREPSQAAE